MRRDDRDHPSVDLEARHRGCDVVAALILDGDDREVLAVGKIFGEQVVALLRSTGAQ